ncbi:AIPR protein [Micromonospora coriariae]|uniref:AIPR protein n=1 Tax=Micromonospora coriariae TaxID=285665 RepID=A0A1C4V2I2_9ACTN|nr:AIPR family protein [Micromonospora coriariae]SCE78300.1 AIPR protein [Micromonospora coriariae]
MDNALDIYHNQLYQEVLAHSEATGSFAEDSFFDVVTEYLITAGEIETADRAPYLGVRGVRVDGYAGDPREAVGVLTLIIVDFRQAERPETLTATDLRAINNRARNFILRSLDPTFRDGLEQAQPAFDLAEMIATTWAVVNKVRIIVITNRVLSSRVDSVPAGEIDGVPITHNVWDLGRLHRYVVAGGEREELELDLVNDLPAPLPALRAAVKGADYDGYLVVIPGAQLAAIYDRWGTRLLEQNVRVFLQSRGSVNRGIKTTLESAPQMFFAYNNGISATAEAVELDSDGTTARLTKIRNLQIVNGGQTTASIHAAFVNNVDLSDVFVQMKLSIVDSNNAADVVPKISEYANSQNRVSQADFFSNHPFHVRIEQFSRRVYAPSLDGSLKQSKWFYERARGQYLDARSGLTAKKRKEFDLEYPREQLFGKTDLAKYSMAWAEQPHVVSRGAQRNFAAFAADVSKKWEDSPDYFSESYYRASIAKAIVWKNLELLIPKQDWYEGGYRANIVAYAIAKLAFDLRRLGRAFDFEAVWRDQALPSIVRDGLVKAGRAVLTILQRPEGNRANVTEWAKHEDCWRAVSKVHVDWHPDLRKATIEGREASARARDGAQDQRILNGIAAQTTVVTAGRTFWQDVLRWGRERRHVTPKEVGILNVCGALPIKIPTEAQSLVALETYGRLRALGLPVELPDDSR